MFQPTLTLLSTALWSLLGCGKGCRQLNREKSEESCPGEQMSEWTGLLGRDLSGGHALLGLCLLLEKGIRW